MKKIKVLTDDKIRNNQIKYRENHPWAKNLAAARERCNNKNNISFKKYGAKGIKCFLSLSEVKYMWFRDNASSMDVPTIDRIDSSKDYTLDNCRFMERYDNTVRSTPAKEIDQFDMNGKFIKRWPSIGSANRYLNVRRGKIWACLKGKKKSFYGYIWKCAKTTGEQKVIKNG